MGQRTTLVSKPWFQHTAARRRLLTTTCAGVGETTVSTHSHAKTAAGDDLGELEEWLVSTHSRAEAAAFSSEGFSSRFRVSTHSRAEAAAD
mgnify:CR=1 FL=1